MGRTRTKRGRYVNQSPLAPNHVVSSRAARPITVRIAGCSQGLVACLSRCAVDRTTTRCRTLESGVADLVRHEGCPSVGLGKRMYQWPA